MFQESIYDLNLELSKFVIITTRKVPAICLGMNGKVEKAFSIMSSPLSVFLRNDRKKVIKEYEMLLARLKTEL